MTTSQKSAFQREKAIFEGLLEFYGLAEHPFSTSP